MKSQKDIFFKNIYWDNTKRIVGKRNIEKDLLKFDKNLSLIDKEKELVDKHYNESKTLIFIVGAPRSGTTLLSQVLTDYLDLSFIDNAVSQYWMAPLTAITSCKSDDKIKNNEFSSFLGTTTDSLSPSEFGYFWEHWMCHSNSDDLSENELNQIDWNGLKRQLFAISNYYKKPLLNKNVNYTNYKIERIYKEFKNVKFIHISRDPFFVIQSCYFARMARYGSVKHWFGVKPRNYKELMKKHWIYQIWHQQLDIETKIKKSFTLIPKSHHHHLSYSDLTNNSELALSRIKKFLNVNNSQEFNNLKLNESNKISFDKKTVEKIKTLINA